MPFVMDCSVALSWYFKDEATQSADALRERLDKESIFVPALWPLEIANAVLVAFRRNRILNNELHGLLADLRELPDEVDQETDAMVWEHGFRLAKQFDLSVYDAAYLELALRKKFAIATLDKALANASQAAGVQLLT